MPGGGPILAGREAGGQLVTGGGQRPPYLLSLLRLVGGRGEAVLLRGDGDAQHGIDPFGPERIKEGLRVA